MGMEMSGDQTNYPYRMEIVRDGGQRWSDGYHDEKLAIGLANALDMAGVRRVTLTGPDGTVLLLRCGADAGVVPGAARPDPVLPLADAQVGDVYTDAKENGIWRVHAVEQLLHVTMRRADGEPGESVAQIAGPVTDMGWGGFRRILRPAAKP